MPSDGPFQVKFGSAWATPRVGSAEAVGADGGYYYATSVLAAI